ncbi:hypothetical protein [Marichromatium bheemlicum]|uniref:DUF3261 domain-containing protein n=1 Tax=Marichromatium bheemlicum TaxID=365339 RepID=A0ABX1IEW3_9GAMM|nr:hypothetical protein [Marichromatium bheemlicum]NKN34695.1 hypothetical protein [Marichromatium bheemlicum]
MSNLSGEDHTPQNSDIVYGKQDSQAMVKWYDKHLRFKPVTIAWLTSISLLLTQGCALNKENKQIDINYKSLHMALPKEGLFSITKTSNLIALEYVNGSVVALSYFPSVTPGDNIEIAASAWFEFLFGTGYERDDYVKKILPIEEIRRIRWKFVESTKRVTRDHTRIYWLNYNTQAPIDARILIVREGHSEGYYEVIYKGDQKFPIDEIVESIDLSKN